MSAALAVTIATEVIKLGGTALELAQAGNVDEAMALLRQAQDRCAAANAAWEDAAQPGDETEEANDDMVDEVASNE